MAERQHIEPYSRDRRDPRQYSRDRYEGSRANSQDMRNEYDRRSDDNYARYYYFILILIDVLQKEEMKKTASTIIKISHNQ
jgi:hypothetical protein